MVSSNDLLPIQLPPRPFIFARSAAMEAGSPSSTSNTQEGEQRDEREERIKELESEVSSLTRQNTSLKNELKFNMDTERRTSGDYIASLKRDLESLQSRNQQISSSLMQAESQLKNNEMNQAKVEATNSAKLAAQSAALVERLSSVQREREKILATQLRKVMDEKKKLIEKLKDQDQEISIEDCDGADESGSEQTQDLLQLVDALQTAKGVFELQEGGDRLLKRVKEIHSEKWKDVQSKIAMLKQESQEALGNKEASEEQIGRLKRQLEILKTEYKLVDKTRTKSLQAQLQSALHERDKWQAKAEKFEDTCETLRVLSSLQRSMSKESEIKQKYEDELGRCHTETEHLTKHLNRMIQERNQLVQERSGLIHQAEQEHERAERLQRLVIVLRRKVMTNSASSNNSDRLGVSLTSSPVYDI